jgi:hypothetical protein
MTILIVSLLLWLALSQLGARPAAVGATRWLTMRRGGTSPLLGHFPTALTRGYEPHTPATTTFWTIRSDGQMVAIYVVLR